MDVVVTVPKNFSHPAAPGQRGLAAWVAEGDAAGEPWTGRQWCFTTFGPRPDAKPGDRCYIVCEGRLRGYAPLVGIGFEPCGIMGAGHINFVRAGGAVAVTIDQRIQGFRGWRYRWWDYAEERPFPDWRDSAEGLFWQYQEARRGR